MGGSHSQDRAAFFDADAPWDADQVDIAHYIWRFECKLWRVAPPWTPLLSRKRKGDGSAPSPRNSQRMDQVAVNPRDKLTMQEAFELLPTMLNDSWVSPLVTVIDSSERVVQSAALALLAKVVSKDSAVDIFHSVGGIQKVMDLLTQKGEPMAVYLALEVVYTLCGTSVKMAERFCEAGLIRLIYTLARSDEPDLVKLSLKILSITLRLDQVKDALHVCGMLPVLATLIESENAGIARAAVLCIGLSLPNEKNLAEILRLGCIDLFLKAMTPANRNVDAVIFALSLIADESDTQFPKELTLSATIRMLETLRGAAKRSQAARAMGFLCASLAKSAVFHSAICTEQNLSIVSKLLVGGSSDVLCAAAFALGVVAIHGNDRVKHTLFAVDAPQNLIQLVTTSPASSAASRQPDSDRDIIRCAVFALGAMTVEAAVLTSGKRVYPTLACSDSLRGDLRRLCGVLLGSSAVRLAFKMAITPRQQVSSSYALKLLTMTSSAESVKREICTLEGVQQLIIYLKCASSELLGCVLMLMIECCTASSTSDHAISESARGASLCSTETGSVFCKLIEQSDDALDVINVVFRDHQPENLLGLADLLSLFVLNSPVLKTRLSTQDLIDSTLAVAARVHHLVLHSQIVAFLDHLTADKNQVAISALFKTGPDRVMNLLQASAGVQVQITAATVLRRVFKRLNSPDMPASPALRHLSRLLSKGVTDESEGDEVDSAVKTRDVALAACRVWGNLAQYEDKRLELAKSTEAVNGVLILLNACITTSRESKEEAYEPPGGRKPLGRCAKQLFWVLRTIHRAVQSDEAKHVLVSSLRFFGIVDVFMHSSEAIVRLSILTVTEIATSPALRRLVMVPAVLDVVLQILRDRDPRPVRVASKVYSLRFLAIVAKKDPVIQKMLVDCKMLEALLTFLHSPATSLNADVLKESLETLAWMCSGHGSPCRRLVATAKVVDFALRNVDSDREDVALASLHLLQRLSQEDPVKGFVFTANGASVVMRALQRRVETDTKLRACALIRNLVGPHDGNRKQFQALGASNYLVALVTCTTDEQSKAALLRLRVKGLEAIGALCASTTVAGKMCKHEVVESDHSNELLALIDASSDKRLTAVWSHALAMVVHGSPLNQKRLVDAGLVPLLVQLLRVSAKDRRIQSSQRIAHFQRAQVGTAQLMAYLAVLPDNRSRIVKEGGEDLLNAVVAGLQSDLHDLHRYAALLVANLTTRNVDNKVKLGTSGVISPLTDRLSSKQLNVLENVLNAISKLGSHAGNKVKFGSKVCFEKLLALLHHEELAIRKNAVAAIAVLIEGNDSNKKFLLQCETAVVPEICALMKAANGKIVESAMLILGELSMLPDQTLEISKFIDIVAVVRMLEHLNAKIRKAALCTVLNLTKESFNKLRFGIKECIDALIACLVSDDLIIVELSITCLGNLSFTPTNAFLVAQHSSSLVLLLKLAAASTTSKDYLSWNESRMLRLAKSPSKGGTGNNAGSPHAARTQDEGETNYSEAEDTLYEMLEPLARDDDRMLMYTYRKTDEVNEEDDQQGEVLDFSSFPSRQTAVLEQTLLILSNCAEELRQRQLVEKVAIKIICQALHHNSELVKRCACYTLACWCKQHTDNQETATGIGVLPTLIQLLNAPSLHIVEAAMYALAKLCYYGDNHVKMLNLDILATLIQGTLRRHANMAHPSLLDRSIRLLGTLVQFAKVRQVIKSEEVIADVLTQVLQLHRTVLAKNVSRLLLAMLLEDSLKFFMPKKTVMLLRGIYTDRDASPKTVRNVLLIFRDIAAVEEHKTTIALEDSGETLAQMVAELEAEHEQREDLLRIVECPSNAHTILETLSVLASSRKVALILHEKHVYAALPKYLAPFSPSMIELADGPALNGDVTSVVDHNDRAKCLKMNLNAVQVLKLMCRFLNERALRQLSALEMSRLLTNLLRIQHAKAQQYQDKSANQLSLLAYECLEILRQLSANPDDEHIMFQEGAGELFLRYLSVWHQAAELNQSDVDDNTTPDGDAVIELVVSPNAFIKPLAASLLGMARGQFQNRQAFVDANGIPLVMAALGVSFLKDDVREELVEVLSYLSPIPTASVLYSKEDTVTPLIKFMIQHREHPHMLLRSLQVLVDMVEMSQPSRRRVVTGGTQGLVFLIDCLLPLPQLEQTMNDKRLRFAINVLECISTEADVAQVLATLPNLPQVHQLLLLPGAGERRNIQLFATEMIGYMTFFGHADALMLSAAVIEKIITFCDFEQDEAATVESISLCVWTLAMLVKTPSRTTPSLAVRVCRWIVDAPDGIIILVNCGFFAPESLAMPSAVVGHILAILLAVVHVHDRLPLTLARKPFICTAFASLLEAVEADIRLPALKLLAAVLSTSAAGEKERWSIILNHLMEWMQVYVQDPGTCTTASILDAYKALSFLTTHPSVEPDFKGPISRSRLIDTVASTLIFFGTKKLPSRPETMMLLCQASGPNNLSSEADQTRADWEHQFGVLLNAMRVLNNLTKFSERYSSRVLQLHVPPVLENLLHLRDSQILVETLSCMNHLATFSGDNRLFFSSDECITQLKSLLQSEKPALQAQITPLLALMAHDMPALPGLCSIDGVNIISDLVGINPTWSDRDPNERRISDDCCAILLTLFAANEQLFVNYDIAQVVPKLFNIVEKNGMPELPLHVLVRISACSASHNQFLKLLPRICGLLNTSANDRESARLGSARLSSESMMLVITILFNLFCRPDSTDIVKMAALLRAGEKPLLAHLFPLNRWVEVERMQPQSVWMVIKIIHVYLTSEPHKTLLNDGHNIPSVLALIGAENEEVAVAASELLLLALVEKDIQISIVVEDGIASLTRTLCSATTWHLQCLILKLLSSMSSDTEVQALLLGAHGSVERIVGFISNRKSVMLSADERLSMSCGVLMHLSRSPTGPQRIVEANGHASVVELSAGQLSVKGDEHRVVTMEILANLALAASKSSTVVTALVAVKIPDHFARCLLHGKSSSSPRASVPMPASEKLALIGIRALSRASEEVCNALVKNAVLVSYLETLLLPEVDELSVVVDAVMTLNAFSKLSVGCLSIAKNTSSAVISRVCGVVSRIRTGDAKQSESNDSSEATLFSVKLLANLLSDVSILQVAWDLTNLASLLPILASILKNHEHSKRQLTALKIVSGTFARRSYFHLTPDMLVDLLNILLISASQQHRVLAERILVSAFQDVAKIRASIVGCQILEQLVIVFAQQPEPIEQRVLAPALVLVFHEAIAHDILVSQRFMSKLVSLLGTFHRTTDAANDVAATDDVVVEPNVLFAHEASLENALCAYLCFAYGNSNAEPSVLSTSVAVTSLRSSIRDVIRADSNATALRMLVRQLGFLHARICTTSARSAAYSPSKAPRPPNNVQLWNCVVDCVIPVDSIVKRTLAECAPVATWWMCLVLDWFAWLQASAVDTANKAKVCTSDRDREEAVVNIGRMVSILTSIYGRSSNGRSSNGQGTTDVATSADTGSQAVEKTVSGMQSRLSSVCISTLWLHVPAQVTAGTARLIESVLQALLDASSSWGENIVLAGCDTNAFTAELLAKLLQVFHIGDPAMDRTRHLLLQFLLLLVSSGRYLEELKVANIREAIEANTYIAASDKAFPVSILGLLGFNADLNDELRKALAKLADAENNTDRHDQIKYIDNFLELYSVTDDETLEFAITVFMRLLTAYVAMVTVAKDSATEQGQIANVDAPTAATNALGLAYLSIMRHMTTARKFPELYLKKWGLSALLGVVFARINGQAINEYQESTLFDTADIAETLQVIVSPIRNQIDADLLRSPSPAPDPLADLDLQTLHHIFATVAQPNDVILSETTSILAERVMTLLEWMMRCSSRCFTDIYDYSAKLRSFLPFVATWMVDPQSSNAVDIWLTILERVVNHTSGRTERLDELLLSLIAFVYNNVAAIPAPVRDRLILCVLIILKRVGEADRAGSASFEHAIEQILSHVSHPKATELQTRCSYDLLGVLTQLDPAITVLFNMDSVQTLLQECGCSVDTSSATPGSPVTPSSRYPPGSWRATKRAVAYCETEALKCLARAAKTHDEVLMKIGAAPRIASFLFRALSKGLELHVGGTVVAMSSHKHTCVAPIGTIGGALGALAAHNRHESTQEHAALLISRIASQEYLRAALLSQENVSILIESLESVHLTVVLASLEALRHLCDFSMCLDALVRHATVPVLAQILFSSSSSLDEHQQTADSVRTASCVMRLLAEMCAKSKVVCRRVVSSHLVPKLKEFLKVVTPPTSSPRNSGEMKMATELRHDSVWVIKSLSKDTELVLKVIDQGLVEALCEHLPGFDPVTKQPKALTALRNLVAVSGALENALIYHVIMTTATCIRKSIPVPLYQRTVAKGLGVFVAIARLQIQEPYRSKSNAKNLGEQDEQWASLPAPKQMLLGGNAIQLALDLLKSLDPTVRLQAFKVVLTFAEGLSDLNLVRELLTSEASTTTGTKTASPPLTAVVRAISDESRVPASASSSELLMVALMLLNVLLCDEVLKTKLTPMAYEVVLQVVIVVAASTAPSQLNAHQHKVVAEALMALAAMTKTGASGEGDSATSSTSPAFKSLETLVRLVKDDTGSLRLNALFLLVNFASAPEMRAEIWSLGGLESLVGILVAAAAHDKIVQLCLLGIALLTSSDDWSAVISAERSATVDQLAGAIDTVVALLKSKNASVQANAVWVVSNLSTVARLKDAIVARGGATMLQSMLNESLLGDTVNPTASEPSGTSAATATARPTSSSLRIREYAPKAIKSLGFVPITPSTAAAPPAPAPPPRFTPKPSS